MEIGHDDACHAGVGLGLKSFKRAFGEWIEKIARKRVGDHWESWCCQIRDEGFKVPTHTHTTHWMADELTLFSQSFESLDTPALLDIVLCPIGWDIFGDYIDRDNRSLLFDVRRHRNKWAHQLQLSLIETFRALDVIVQLLEFFGKGEFGIDCVAELNNTKRMLDDLILQLAQMVQLKRRFGESVQIDGDGDVQMKGGDADD